MERKLLKYNLIDYKETTSFEAITLMELLNDKCKMLEAFNKDNGVDFEPQVGLGVTDKNNIFGYIINKGKYTVRNYNDLKTISDNIHRKVLFNGEEVPFTTYTAYTLEKNGCKLKYMSQMGYIHLEDEAYVDNVMTNKIYRHNGVGYALFNIMLNDIKKLGVKYCVLDAVKDWAFSEYDISTKEDTRVDKFYKKLKFKNRELDKDNLMLPLFPYTHVVYKYRDLHEDEIPTKLDCPLQLYNNDVNDEINYDV